MITTDYTRNKIDDNLKIIYKRLCESKTRRQYILQILSILSNETFEHANNPFHDFYTKVVIDFVSFIIITLVEILPLRKANKYNDDVNMFKTAFNGMRYYHSLENRSEDDLKKQKWIKELLSVYVVNTQNFKSILPDLKKIRDKGIGHITGHQYSMEIMPILYSIESIENSFFFIYKKYFELDMTSEPIDIKLLKVPM